MFVLQAHRSSCSQQGPTWPCLLSSPTATATQQHQATASRHSPASVTACEQPEYPHHHHHTHLDLTWHLPSICPSLCVPHQLPMVFYSQQGPQASNSPLSFWVLFFYYVVLLQEKTYNCIEGTYYYFYCLKRNWTMFVCFSHSIFMTTYLDLFCLFLCWCHVFFIGLCRSGLAKAQQWAFEVGGGALDFALVKKLM